jgi:hypothetical protein
MLVASMTGGGNGNGNGRQAAADARSNGRPSNGARPRQAGGGGGGGGPGGNGALRSRDGVLDDSAIDPQASRLSWEYGHDNQQAVSAARH